MPGTASARAPPEIGAAAAAAAAKGYRGLKFDPFEDAGRDPDKASIRKAVEIVEAVRAATGPDVDLMIDAHGRFSPGSAIAIARELEPCDLFWLEEPCDPENAASLAMVGRNIKTRLATGERCTSRAAMAGLLETHEVDVLQPDIIHVGGIMEGKKIAAMADAYYIPVSFHNPFGPVATAAAVQLDACTTNFFMQESFCEYDVDFRFDLLEHAPRPENGRYVGAGSSGPRRRRIPPRRRAARIRSSRTRSCRCSPTAGRRGFEHQEFGPRCIDTGCQRRRPLFGSTVGLTHDIGQRPDSTSASSRPTRRRRPSSKRAEAEALCGERITCGILISGLSGFTGSTWKTSSPAPRSSPPAAP